MDMTTTTTASATRLFVGAAWPYASGPRHVGHLAGAYLPADVIARAARLAGREVLFVSGSDQFGTPITVAAERAGVPPRQLADAHHAAIAATFRRAGIAFDHYTKTGTATHERVVHDVFRRLDRRGLVAEEEREGAWCPRHRRSLPDRYVEGTCPHCGDDDARGDQCDACGTTLEPAELVAPRCRECGTGAELRRLPQLVLRLDRLADEVTDWLARTSPGWSRTWAADEAVGALREGLRARAITRDLPWGVPVPRPGWEDRRLYVWFDAVIGYLSATVEWAERHGAEPTAAWQRWWLADDVEHRYVVGQDNLWFHAAWWPAILAGASTDAERFHLPDEVVASRHLTERGAQLSTSRGHGTTLDDALDRWGVDAVRHAVAALAPETADSELTDDAVDDATRTGLLGAIANPCHRVTTLWWRRFGDAPAGDASPRERAAAQRAVDEAAALLQQGSLRKGLAAVHAIGRTINRRLAETEPWKAADDATARRHLEALLPWVDAVALAAWPIVPDTSEAIRSATGRSPRPTSWVLPPRTVRITAAPAPPLARTPVAGRT
jgi:methionyl-tRNA synthetase